MDYDVGQRRYSHNMAESALTYPPHYIPERNIPLLIPHYTRTDARNYPIGGPVGGPLRGQDFGGREDITDSGPTRKRVALACGRCRKRKIRCSGDPGNGTGCMNCKSAGAEQCQFHRVGSRDFPPVLTSSVSQMTSGSPVFDPNAMMPIYNAAGNTTLSRGLSVNNLHQVDSKYMVSQWAVPYSEDSSPVRTYGLGQPSAYLPTSNNLAALCGDSYRWDQPDAFYSGSNSYAHSDAITSSSYSNHGFPYISRTTHSRNSMANLPISPLNMAPLQDSLPMAPPRGSHPPAPRSRTPVQQRQLPYPQPCPALTSRNTIDRLHDQRLRSSQALNGPLIVNGSYPTKPSISWNSGNTSSSDVSRTASPVDTSSKGMVAQPTTAGPLNSNAGSVSANGLGFLPMTTSEDLATTNSLPHLNFGTSSILEVLVPPTQTYSNFRDYNLPTSSSARSLGLLARPSSRPSLCSYTSDNTLRRNSIGTSGETSLINGQRYSPLNQLHALTGVSMSHVPAHRASMSNLNNHNF